MHLLRAFLQYSEYLIYQEYVWGFPSSSPDAVYGRISSSQIRPYTGISADIATQLFSITSGALPSAPQFLSADWTVKDRIMILLVLNYEMLP